MSITAEQIRFTGRNTHRIGGCGLLMLRAENKSAGAVYLHLEDGERITTFLIPAKDKLAVQFSQDYADLVMYATTTPDRTPGDHCDATVEVQYAK